MSEHEHHQSLLIAAFAALVERKDEQIGNLQSYLDIEIQKSRADSESLRDAIERANRYEGAAEKLHQRCIDLVNEIEAANHRRKPNYDPIAHKIWNDAAVPEQVK